MNIAIINVTTGAVSFEERAPSFSPVPAGLRITEIDARLTSIDFASVRALRATVAGTATEADAAQLSALETEAAVLRAERAGLVATLPDA